MLPDRLFITGTDTEVGKSVVTASIAAATGARALKPIASGVTPGTAGEDAELLARACGHIAETAISWVPPVSPHRAGEDTGRHANLQQILAWIQARSAPKLLVEGVGGWRVPISWDFGVPELAQALDFPVLVVAANRLGVLNHTLLTVDAVRHSGLQVAGVVLNDLLADAGQDISRASNLADLRALLDVPVWSFPRLPGLSREELAAGWRAASLQEGLQGGATHPG